MNSFEELCKALAERIDKSETRERGRTAEAKQSLLTSTYQLVGQLWKGTQIHEGYEAASTSVPTGIHQVSATDNLD